MGIFNKLSTLFRSNLNDLMLDGRKPGEDAESDHSRHARPAREGEAAGRRRHRGRETLKAPGGLRGQAGRGLGEARDAGAPGRTRRSREAGTAAAAGARRARPAAHDTWQQQAIETEKLKESLRELNDKIEEAKRKKNLLVARQKRAEAQKRIHETMHGLSDQSAFEAFDRMASRIEDNERMALASAEVAEDLGTDHLETEFKRLEITDTADVRLLEMKRKMGKCFLLPTAAKETRKLGSGMTQPQQRQISANSSAPVRDAELIEAFDLLESAAMTRATAEVSRCRSKKKAGQLDVARPLSLPDAAALPADRTLLGGIHLVRVTARRETSPSAR